VEQTIEVRYAGVVIGRVTGVGGADDKGVFLGTGDPMPVGTAITLQVGGDVAEGRVEQVLESTDPARSGMRVRFDDPSALSLFGVPGAPARSARTSASAPAPVAAAGAAAAASVADAGGDAGGDGADGEADRGAAPDGPSSPGDSGAQAGGGGRRRRRRR